MKTMTLYRPNTIQSTMSDFDRYFESFFGDSALTPATRSLCRQPAVDVRETENAYIVDMELPGYEENGIEIHVDGKRLSIASKQEETKEASSAVPAQDQGTWIIRERRFSSFSRSFKLPENANPEEVSAQFKNGVLSVDIKKRPEAQKRTIQIKAN